MGGSSKKQTVGYKYFLGMHQALCHGPVDKLVRIQVDKRDAWVGSVTAGRLTVDAPKLFGGESREGGVAGDIDFEPGASDQGQNDYLASKISADVPNFRGVCAAVLRQVYCGMNPYLKPWSWRVQRIHTRQDGIAQWYDAKAAILLATYAANTVYPIDLTQYPDDWSLPANPDFYQTVDTPYGRGMQITNVTFNADGVSRSIPPAEYKRIEFKAVVDINVAGAETYDADIAAIVFGGALSVYLSRDASGTGSSERAMISNTYVGSQKLSVGTWYQFVLDLDWDTAQISWTVTNIADASVFATGVSTFITTSPIGSIGFDTDVANDPERLNDAGTYADIVLYTEYQGLHYDMNPAHIIRECLTDPNWGMGYPEADMDDAAFMAAADTLWAEKMGISILWDRQIPLEDFIKEILKHIDAVLYVDRTTGEFVLKLIRDDYDAGTLLVLNEDNCERVDSFKTPALGELVNSITINYWDSASGNDASLTVHDTALAQLQGGVVNTTVEYPGFTNGAIAARIAARDLKSLSTPIVTCTIYANREASGLNVGDAFKLVWPEYGIGEMVMRVTAMAYGDGKSNRIRIQATQDVFSLPEAYVATPTSGWTDPVTAPAPCPHEIAIEAPYYELVQRMGQDEVDAELTAHPERGYLLVAGDRPDGAAIHATVLVDAGAGYVESAQMDFAPSAVLAAAVGPADTALTLDSASDLDLVEVGSHAQLGDEIVRIDAISDTAATIGRGCLDTVPASHAAGTALIAWDAYAASDNVEYADGEVIAAKLLPVTGQGVLDPAAAADLSVTLDQRAVRPYPPGQFKINSSYYPATIGVADALSLAWSHRDRTQQTTGTLQDTTYGDIGPETGTTYTLRIYGETDTLLRTVNQSTTTYLYAVETEKTDSLLEDGVNLSAWAVELTGATASAYLSACAVDGSDVVAFGTNNSDSSTRGDVQVVKINGSTGSVIWQKKSVRVGHEIPSSGVVDSAGKLRAVGREYNSPYYAGLALSLNSDGSFSAQRITSSAENVNWIGCCAGASGAIYASGNNASGVGLVAKLASDNTISVSKTLTGMNSVYAGKVSGSSIVFPGFTSSPYKACITKMPDDLSAITWARQLAGSTSTYCGSLAVDGAGNIYGSAHVSDVSKGLYVFKYNASGMLQWQRRLYDGTNQFYRASVTVVSDGVIITGSHAGGAGIIAKYSTTGTLQWQFLITHSSGAVGFASEAALIGDVVYLAGNVASTRFILIKLPVSGPTAGTYGPWTIATSTFTEAAGDLTDGAATLSLGSWSPTTSSVTPTVSDTAFSTSYNGMGSGDPVYRLNGRLRVELESVRDGLASYQHHDHTVYRPGYGFNYGMFYGGI